MYVYLYVCLLAHLKIDMSKLHQFSVHVTPGHGSVLRWCQYNMLRCYVSPVMWMISCFHITERKSQNKTTYMFCPVRQMAAPDCISLWQVICQKKNSLRYRKWFY